MKKYLVGLVAVISTFIAGIGFTHATDFRLFLDQKGRDTTYVAQQSSVTRYTLAELLNFVECNDCHRPSEEVLKNLTNNWWNTFRALPGKNFDDIPYSTSLADENNYYCVAYVGNQGYMNGYPRSTSPICSGKFCGDLNTTNADFIQTVFNITAPTFMQQYSADWVKINNRIATQSKNIQAYFSLEERIAVNQKANSCDTQPCQVTDLTQFNAYMKYCTFVPEVCGFTELPFAKKGEWPLAEMNVLLKQGIFSSQEIQNLNIGNYAPGTFILSTLGRVKERMQCVDTVDQDDDEVLDRDDNCYLVSNPNQRDQDGDGIGDVCDDDIDGDTIKNPIGVVDDEGNIRDEAFSGYTGELDNCIFIPNTDQKDDDDNGVGNACDILEEDRIGLAIAVKQNMPNTYGFTAVYTGVFETYRWYFGDKNTGLGQNVGHIYPTPGQYTVRLEGTTPKGKIVNAYATVEIGESSRAAIMPEKLIFHVGEKNIYTLTTTNINPNNIESIHLAWGDGREAMYTGGILPDITDMYYHQGGYHIYGTLQTYDQKVYPLGAYVTVLGGDLCTPQNALYQSVLCENLPPTSSGEELIINYNFPPTSVGVGECRACPCQYVKNDSSLLPGDRVKAVLFDTGTNSYVTESQWYTVQ